jgi:hypothetical protein
MGLWVMQLYNLRLGGSKLARHLRILNPQDISSLADRNISNAPQEQ